MINATMMAQKSNKTVMISEQRSLQKKLEQPLIVMYSHNFKVNETFNQTDFGLNYVT